MFGKVLLQQKGYNGPYSNQSNFIEQVHKAKSTKPLMPKADAPECTKHKLMEVPIFQKPGKRSLWTVLQKLLLEC